MSRVASAFALLIVLLASVARAATVRESATSTSASESTCDLGPPAARFRTDQSQVFFRFIARNLSASDQVRVDWVNPSGTVELSTPWGEVPTSRALCFLTQMPLAGFASSTHPGAWTVQVVINGTLAHQREFELDGDPHLGSAVISEVRLEKAGEGQTRFVLSGSGFELDSITHIAQFTPQGEWQYLFASLPSQTFSSDISFSHATLPPGEYLAIIRNPDGTLSPPARFVVSTGRGYHSPVPLDQPWVITQGPHGAFSHWNNSKHAWDIAPRGDRHVVAMRAGIVHTHDLGLRQSQTVRSFGNYITIDHGDGEFSHYAHLATGSFLVREGQRVEPGELLARAGNSGYTFGQSGGFHLHVHVTRSARISAPSIPFEFSDWPGGRRLSAAGGTH